GWVVRVGRAARLPPRDERRDLGTTMAEMLTPLEWDAPRPAAATAADAGADKLPREEFRWPTPPYASYPIATPQTDPLPCEIVGLNDKRMTGRLTFFVPEEKVAHVQLPPART